MPFPWLRVQQDPEGSGLLLYEHNLHRFSEMRQFMLSLVEDDKQGLEVWLRDFDADTAIVECHVPSAQYDGTKYSRNSFFNQICGEVLMPFSYLMLLDADNLGGQEVAARVLARWVAHLPLTSVLPPPHLIVISSEMPGSQVQFQRHLTTELLCLLREQHPEQPYSRHEVTKMWSSRVDGVQFVQHTTRQHITAQLNEISQNRHSLGFCFTSANFKDLLHKAVMKSCNKQSSFDIFKSFGIQDPSSMNAKTYLNEFLSTNGHCHDLVASCLAYNIYAQASHCFHPGLVFQSLVEPFLIHDVQQPVQSIEIIRSCFISLVGENIQEVISNHVQKMKRAPNVPLPGCSLCLLGTPINPFSCGHEFCSYCTTATGHICILCGKENQKILRERPLAAGIRTLELFESTNSPLGFLHRVRVLLLGHLAEYVDLVIGLDSAASVIQGHFQDGFGLPQLSRKKAKKAMRPKSKPSVCTAVSLNGRLHRNYGPPSRRRRCPLLPRTFLYKRNKSNTVDLTQLVFSECHSLWKTTPRLRIQCNDNCTLSAEAVAGRLFAALFYIELVSVPDLSTCPIYGTIDLRCRLPPGQHLNAVMHAAVDSKLMIHYTSSGRWHREPVCLKNWNHSEPYSKQLKIGVSTPEGTLEVKIDSHVQAGRQESISNTPCRLSDLRKLINVEGITDKITEFTGESGSLLDRIATIDTEIDSLLVAYQDLRK